MIPESGSGATLPVDRSLASGQAVGGVDDAARGQLTVSYLRDRYVRRRWSSQRIAEESGWSSQKVRDQLREFGIPVRPRASGPRAGGTADAATVVALCRQGILVAEICRRTGYTQRGVYRVLRKHGLRPPRPRADAAALAERDEAARLYGQGLSLADVGARFGRGQDWARARVLAAGVALRPGGTRRGSSALKASAVRPLLDKGLAVAEIADELGFPAHTVRWVIRSQGWPAPGRATFAARPTEDDVRRLYVDQHRTITATAADLGTSVHQVKAALDAAGIPRRPRGLQPRLDEDVAILRQLYLDQQLGLSALAARYGCTEDTVAKALTRHGIARDRTWDMDTASLRALYVEQRLDDIAIGARYGIPPYRVRKRREQLGIRRPPTTPPQAGPPPTPGAERLRELYVDQSRTLVQIARAHHTSVPVVRRWMQQAGVPVKARTSRSHRRPLDPDVLRSWYVDRGWSAADIAAELDTTVHLVLRTLHDQGIPVRLTRRCPQPYVLVQALYEDDQVLDLLARHQIPVRDQPGPIAARFPRPMPLSRELLHDAYVQLGLSARHIELLTGQPAGQVLDALHAAGIPVRTQGGHSPWLRAAAPTVAPDPPARRDAGAEALPLDQAP